MTDLSPAAQAVLDAIDKELDEAPWDVSHLAGSAAAAALRAAAIYCTRERRILMTIADELET
jgi:hypothetical protein